MFIILTLTIFAIGTIFAGAVTDVIRLRIPNIIPIVVVAAFITCTVMAALFNHPMLTDTLLTHMIAAMTALAVMVVLFFMRLFGGGDAKLIPAVVLWIGVTGLPVFLMATAVTGGLLALLSVLMRKTSVGKHILTRLIRFEYLQSGWIAAMAKGENVVPYGVAIACGALAGFRSSGLLP